MQVFEHHTKLDGNLQRGLHGQFLAGPLLQVIFQRLTLDIIHDEVPTPHIRELLIDARQVGMGQSRQQHGFALEGFGRLDQFLRTQAALAHLLDRHLPVAKLEISRLVDRAEPALAYLL